jgi:signal transduction histidine kinase
VRQLRSLGGIATGFALLLSAATVLTGVAVYLALVAAVDHQVDLRIDAEANELLDGAPDLTEIARRIARKQGERDTADIGFLLRDGRGRAIVGNILPAQPVPFGRSTIGRDAAIPGLSRGRAWQTSLSGGGTLTLLAESEPVDRHDRKRVTILAAGFGSVVLIVLAGIAALIWTIRANIATLRATAEAIIDGDLRARVPVARASSAFGGLARSYNRMLDRIGELMASMRGISNDIAHDLRTPLARLHGRLAALADAPEAAPVRAEIDAAVSESTEILDLFAAMLRIAEIEGGARRSGFAHIDLAHLVADALEGLRLLVEDGGRWLVAPPPANALPIEGDARLLTQLLVNLVENCLAHTPPGTTVTVRLAATAHGAELVVQDDGPGIPPAARTQALRRFGRLETSRATRGHGLGLPLAAAIAHLHGGSLELDDATPGLLVRIRIPAFAT